MKKIFKLAKFLLIVGGINWLLVGLWEFNLINYVFTKVWLDRIIYVLVGFAAFFQCVSLKHNLAKKAPTRKR